MDASTVRSKLRLEMPVARELAYYDHAAVSPLPQRAGQAIVRFAEQAVGSGDTCWLQWAAGVETTRQAAARLIGADTSEIALLPNTTTSISVIAEGFPWQPGDNVVVPDNEFPSNLLPWLNLARRGVQVRTVAVPAGGQLLPQDIDQCIDQRTRIVALSWIGFASGFRCDLQQIAELVQQRGCLLMLDAIQGLGAFSVDVSHTPIDFLAADGHKWLLGPEGAGMLYVRSRHLDMLQPLGVGWNSLASGTFDPRSRELKATAERYEGGSASMVGMLAFGSSLELLLELDCNAPSSPVAQAILENVDQLVEALRSDDFQVEVPESQQHRSGILGVRWLEAERIGEAHYLRARKYLLTRGIATSVRGGRLRLSTHAYNNSEDCQRLVEALADFRQSQ
ncbi:MAG: aminotransferase class V-fold PLP-dependent enzyme [Pirellulaceae bacterium]|nr:aminotransferase class V-fold PLP-dependent enzyme [Pirellulaceae bacterium]